MSTPLLRRGDAGERVRDLQERLVAAGFPALDEPDAFGEATERAVRAFQEARRLRVDGVCGPETWSALVESAYRLGDRLLYLRAPMLRGDDVAELQHLLNRLGFDAGREDGIFGPGSERALRQFQRDAGLAPDGVCGPATRDVLDRVGTLAGGSVASVRERENLLREPRRLAGQRVFVAIEPGLDALGARLARELAAAGASVVLDVSGEDDSLLATAANRYAADVCMAVRTASAPSEQRCSFFEHRRFRSETGYCLARRVEEELARVLGPTAGPVGRSNRILRETRMPAILCEPLTRGDLAAMQHLVTHSTEVARAIAHGLRLGIEDPVGH